MVSGGEVGPETRSRVLWRWAGGLAGRAGRRQARLCARSRGRRTHAPRNIDLLAVRAIVSVTSAQRQRRQVFRALQRYIYFALFFCATLSFNKNPAINCIPTLSVLCDIADEPVCYCFKLCVKRVLCSTYFGSCVLSNILCQ